MDSNVASVWKGATHAERMVWLCIRNHYTAENPISTAAGAGQWLNGTWDGLKDWVKVNGKFVARQYDEAKDAPAWVQDAAFRHVYKRGGLSMWRGTGCPGT
jgi:muramidase (phage lysozyme)